jgi:hypothetical protein
MCQCVSYVFETWPTRRRMPTVSGRADEAAQRSRNRGAQRGQVVTALEEKRESAGPGGVTRHHLGEVGEVPTGEGQIG